MIDDQPRAFSPRLERALYALALLLLALRFLWPGDTIYILDEAFLQMRIDEHFAAGTIPLSNSRGSSIPLPYGPGGQWFYMALRLVHWHPVFLALCHMTLQLGGALLFFRVIRKAYGREAGAWCALLVAASPLLFFFARHTWDNTLLIPLGSLALWLLQRLDRRKEVGRDEGTGLREYLHHAALGLVIGYGVNTHLMFGPVAVAMGLALLLRGGKRHGISSARLWISLASFAGTALLVLLPYLLEAIRIAREEKPLENARVKEHWGDFRNLWWLFQRTALYSSLFQANVSFGDLKKEFSEFSGPFFAFFFYKDLFGWFGKIAAWGGAIVVLVRLCRGRIEEDSLRLFAALAFFFTLLVYQYLNIPTAPHYFNPVWWFVFVGIAYTITKLQGVWKRLFLATIIACLFVNMSYIAFATAYIRENRGARNMETSVVVVEQMRIFRDLCTWGRERGKAEVLVRKEVHLGEPAFDFLPAHMPECIGVKLRLVNTGENLVIRYTEQSPFSAALTLAAPN
jgi:4-amino-4-deoxy-L-arabinose transferase-like glycosyltransferase